MYSKNLMRAADKLYKEQGNCSIIKIIEGYDGIIFLTTEGTYKYDFIKEKIYELPWQSIQSVL